MVPLNIQHLISYPSLLPGVLCLQLNLGMPAATLVLMQNLLFSCRSYNDSCFLDAPLYPELADVQWYGQEKAKPGTLV